MEGKDMNWRKSSYSGNGGVSCIETASGNGLVTVRDTTNRDGGTLVFTASAWREFLATARLAPVSQNRGRSAWGGPCGVLPR